MNDRPILKNLETTVEQFPIEPSVKEILEKILEQNKMVLEQNARILSVLSTPAMMLIK